MFYSKTVTISYSTNYENVECVHKKWGVILTSFSSTFLSLKKVQPIIMFSIFDIIEEMWKDETESKYTFERTTSIMWYVIRVGFSDNLSSTSIGNMLDGRRRTSKITQALEGVLCVNLCYTNFFLFLISFRQLVSKLLFPLNYYNCC